MTSYYVIVMRDIRADVHTLPEMWHREEQAVRAFEDRCASGKMDDLVARHPQDFELIVIGEYDDNTATWLEYQKPNRRQLALGKARPKE